MIRCSLEPRRFPRRSRPSSPSESRIRSASPPTRSTPRSPTKRPGFTVASLRASHRPVPVALTMRANATFERHRRPARKPVPASPSRPSAAQLHISAADSRPVPSRRHPGKCHRIPTPGSIDRAPSPGASPSAPSSGKWWPSAINIAVIRSSASCAQMRLGCLGSGSATPFPRCVRQLRSCRRSPPVPPQTEQCVCPIETCTPRARNPAM